MIDPLRNLSDEEERSRPRQRFVLDDTGFDGARG